MMVYQLFFQKNKILLKKHKPTHNRSVTVRRQRTAYLWYDGSMAVGYAKLCLIASKKTVYRLRSVNCKTCSTTNLIYSFNPPNVRPEIINRDINE